MSLKIASVSFPDLTLNLGRDSLLIPVKEGAPHRDLFTRLSGLFKDIKAHHFDSTSKCAQTTLHPGEYKIVFTFLDLEKDAIEKVEKNLESKLPLDLTLIFSSDGKEKKIVTLIIGTRKLVPLVRPEDEWALVFVLDQLKAELSSLMVISSADDFLPYLPMMEPIFLKKALSFDPSKGNLIKELAALVTKNQKKPFELLFREESGKTELKVIHGNFKDDFVNASKELKNFIFLSLITRLPVKPTSIFLGHPEKWLPQDLSTLFITWAFPSQKQLVFLTSKQEIGLAYMAEKGKILKL